MKNRFKFLCVALVLASAGVQAQSQAQSGGMYGEVGLTSVKVSSDGYSLTPRVLRGVVGYEVNPNFAIEGMVGFGVSDDTVTVSGFKVAGEVDHMIGLFVKPKVAVSPDLELFARAGFVRTKVTASLSGFGLSASDSQSDVSYGVGLAYSISKGTSLNLDYMSYYNKDGVKANGVTLGVGFKF